VGVKQFWLDRPTLVTGATGLVGGWLVRRLVEAGADVVCLVRDWVPQCELVQSHLVERTRIVRGDVCDQALLERALGEYEIATVIHLAAQTIVTIANRNPVSTFETNVQGTWSLLEACRRSPAVQRSSWLRRTRLTGITRLCPTMRKRRFVGGTLMTSASHVAISSPDVTPRATTSQSR